MRWGLYNDMKTRPEGEPSLVYFSGIIREGPLVVGLGGSSVHVEGHKGATSTYSRSATPSLVKWLLSGLHKGAPPEKTWWEQTTETHVYQAMAVALHEFPPPSISMQFLAKKLCSGTLNHYEYMIGVDQARMLLGTPIWVAEAPPYFSQENHWGLDDQW